jgi:DNA-binding HxlR family transcriptional regulator
MRVTRQEGTFTAPRRAGEAADCVRITELLSRVGDKWAVVVIRVLGSGPMRFNALRRGIGDILQKMLATALRGLERDGFVVRTVTPSTPPQVVHGLTDLGRRLLAPVCALARLTIANAGSIEEAGRRHAARGDGGLRTGGARDFSAP